ncbi:MAG: D-alanyl-D-alanine carboxypeptidase family protein [Firmicutes bacterium]|nr:D-alanyl-D-alanine carboxypeptidase family protein [Bacillota bacterium]
MRKKRRKLKKQVWYIIAALIFIPILTYAGINVYEKEQYKKTYEYKFLQHGYTLEEYTLLKETFPKNLDQFLTKEKNTLYIDIINEPYFIKDNFDAYIKYLEEAEKEISLSKTISIINSKTNNDFYSLDLKSDLSKKDLIIVNKYYQLEKDFEPNDLVSIPTTYAWGSFGDVKIREIAYNAFLNMWHKAKEEGFYLMVKSGFRSYTSQETVYNDYLNKYGDTYADSIAARPGHSEHQTGLAMDIYSKENTNQKTFKDSQTAQWLFNNAHLYGFILRYPEDKVDLTGYNYESWHYRYVGKEVATEIFNKNITFEEYYAYYLEK